MPELTPDQKRKLARNAPRQFYALGRFVQEFEQMVDIVRHCSVGIIGVPAPRDTMVLVILSHRALTAIPLIDSFLGIIGEIVRYKDQNNPKLKRFIEICSSVQNEYRFLAEKRNELLHGTWRVGGLYSENYFPDMPIFKFKSSLKRGIHLAETPKSARELISLAKRCRKTKTLIQAITHVVTGNDCDPDLIFLKKGSAWCLRDPKQFRA